jgi:hypothetical protein
MRKRFGLVEPQAEWEVRAVLCVWQQCCAYGSSVLRLNVVQVQRLSKELGQELFGQHVKAFEVSTLT